jgi:cytochrome c oxidase cbb3-type subunit I
MNPGQATQPAFAQGQALAPAITPAEIDLSCRVPLLVLFLSAAVWFLLGSIGTFLCSIKFHSPNFLADAGWLTYGRLLPAARTALLYGGCMQAGLGVGLWLLARLGRVPMRYPLPAIGGAVFWNLGVTIAFIGILLGDSTGFEYLELPPYSVLILFLGYLLLGVQAAVMFHHRRERLTFVSQWFLFVALFWFPWIYSSAELLLVAFPVRGVAQSVLAWWYADNLLVVWLGLTGLAAAFYFVPKLTGRDLHSHYLALFAFWIIVLFGSWGGVPNSAPVPAWMPALSTVSRVLTLLAIIAVAVNIYRTSGALVPTGPRTPALSFVLFGVGAFVVAGLMRAFGGLLDWDQELHFTWFATARTFLHFYGFFAMVMFGAVYYILPRLLGPEFPCAKLVRAHLWVAGLGVLLVVVPLGIAGVSETFQLQNPKLEFLSIVKSTLGFLRVSTIGDFLLVVGHVLFLVNLAGLVTSFYRARAVAAYAVATADLYPTGGTKA